RYVHLRGGFRADILYYSVDDRLANFTPSSEVPTHLPGSRRDAFGVAYGPRATIELDPLPWLQVLGSYGQGYRSPQALQLVEGEKAPYAKVHSWEGGVRLRPDGGERLTVTLAGYATFLSQDLAFDPEEGRVETIGPTSRRGAVANVLAQPWSWAIASLSVTYVHATLDAPPPPTAESPAPPYTSGELLPYVPPIVLRGDIGAHRRLFDFRGAPAEGRVGAGLTYLSPRPLPYGNFGVSVTLLDVSASLRWRIVELGLELFNLLDTRYEATQYSFVSNWQSE